MRPLALTLFAVLCGGQIAMLWFVGESHWLFTFGLALGVASPAVLIWEMTR